MVTSIGQFRYVDIFVSEDDTGPIAFSAHASQDRDYNDDDVVIFDEIVTNNNGAFQANNSVFLCPVDGLYAFSAHILSASGQKMRAAIFKENSCKAGFETDSMDQLVLNGSNFVIFECNAWQRVWLRATADGCRIFGAYDFGTFSGFLIHRY